MNKTSILWNGVICQSTGSWCVVKKEDEQYVKTRIRGRLKLQTERTNFLHPLAVGDKVELVQVGEDYVIQKIKPARNMFSRYIPRMGKDQLMACNVDQVFIIASLKNPYVPLLFIDTIIAAAEIEEITPILVLNKQDLYAQEEQTRMEFAKHLYTSLGYSVMTTSAYDDASIEPLKKCIAQKTTMLIGYSGSGKSSLINALVPEANALTQEVSEAHQTGIHTTTFSTMYELPTGGFLVDSPGVRSFEISPIAYSTLRLYFREFLLYQAQCGFTSCTHLHEEKCAVRDAISSGKITKERYYSYQSIFAYLKDIHDNTY